MTRRIFLGGTCGNNNWREPFTETLVSQGVPRDIIFNPVVKDWNEEAQKREEEEKAKALAHFYYVGDPKVPGLGVGVYSLVELTMALYDHPDETVVVIDLSDLRGINPHSLKSLMQTERVLRVRFPQAAIFTTLDSGALFLSQMVKGVFECLKSSGDSSGTTPAP